MKRTTLSTILILSGIHCFAQDINYSNIHFITQLYNPALAAAKYDLESSIIYRSQWRANNSKYESYGFSFAATLMPNRRNRQGNLTTGINFYREQMNARFSATSALATTSYHIYLDDNSMLSAGINYGIFDMGLDPDNGEWASQHDGIRFNPNMPSGEIAAANKLTKFDVGTGGQYALLNDKINVPIFQIGLAGFHVNQPKLSILGGNENRLPMRLVFNGSCALPLGIKGTYLQGNLSHQRQASFKTTTIGIIAAIKFKEAATATSSFSKVNEWYAGIGTAIRTNDAFILNLFIQKSNLNLALAYDFTTSDLKRSNNSKGAYELILAYNIPSFKPIARY